MKSDGYFEHLDLGIDPESGERNLLVRSATEFFRLPEDQQYRAWAVVKVAAEILERPAMTVYQHICKGKITPKDDQITFPLETANRNPNRACLSGCISYGLRTPQILLVSSQLSLKNAKSG